MTDKNSLKIISVTAIRFEWGLTETAIELQLDGSDAYRDEQIEDFNKRITGLDLREFIEDSPVMDETKKETDKNIIQNGLKRMSEYIVKETRELIDTLNERMEDNEDYITQELRRLKQKILAP